MICEVVIIAHIILYWIAYPAIILKVIFSK